MSSDEHRPDFIEQQYAFAAHIRNPEDAPPPEGIEDRRMAIYRDLFYNNVEGFIAGNFPVLRSITDDDRWHALIRDFFIKHRCATPLFAEIAQEFIAYLQEEREAQPGDPVFMVELAHYEWVELAVSISDADRNLPAHDPNGDLLEGIPLVSPVAWNLTYHYPVHCIGPDHQPQGVDGQLTHLVVYRDRADEVHFLEINAVSQRLLQLMKENPMLTGLNILKIVAKELKAPNPQAVIAAGLKLLADLKQRNILLGTRTA